MVVLFNHHADAIAAGKTLIAAALDLGEAPASDLSPASDCRWRGRTCRAGAYFDAEAGLAAHVEQASAEGLRLRCAATLPIPC
ncbi:hypothetical protein ACRAWD_22405 [Caulobacter segnis]